MARVYPVPCVLTRFFVGVLLLLQGLTGEQLTKVAGESGFEGLRTYLHSICVDAYNRKVQMVEAMQPGLMSEVQK